MKRIVASLSWLIMTGLVIGMGVVCASSSFAQEDTKKDESTKVEAKSDAEPDTKADAPKGDASKAEGNKAETAGENKPADHSHAKGEGHDHAEGDNHGHDPNDNTHKNASPQLSKVDEIRFDQAVATFVIFMLLSAILAKFAWGPISDGLDKREAGIAKMIDDARLAQEQAEAQLRSYESKLAAATEEARTMVAQARADAEAAKDRIQNEAKELAAKERAKAIDDINNAKNAALQQIAEKSVNTAITLASNIVRREVKPEDHDRLVSDALGQFSKLN